ncbi:hypothetical protein HAX54_050994 [Datura stramonium]|uniref:Uncharacterized protein n=1 Tax=Datura stramonium TaxID=4076 RepID=A0ABS8RHY0_DATST|nr:hypothetical protein [Datura stramonium]
MSVMGRHSADGPPPLPSLLNRRISKNILTEGGNDGLSLPLKFIESAVTPGIPRTLREGPSSYDSSYDSYDLTMTHIESRGLMSILRSISELHPMGTYHISYLLTWIIPRLIVLHVISKHFSESLPTILWYDPYHLGTKCRSLT